MIKVDAINYKIYTIPIEDVDIIKNVYKNKGSVKDNDVNVFNIQTSPEVIDRGVLSGEEYICDSNNLELLNIIKKHITFDEETEYFSSIHFINYNVNDEVIEHLDIPYSNRTYVISLNDGFEGGEFYIRKKLIPQAMGNMVYYMGNIPHSVKKIKSGNREVLVIWINKIQKNKKTLL
jgi:hypothetical protein